LKAVGRLSVMVAIAPSIRSSAGSSGCDVRGAGVDIGNPGKKEHESKVTGDIF
jgi:hypothetical protein